MQRIVLDTNILVSAFWSADGCPAKVLEMVMLRYVQLVYSNLIMAEYKSVLSRPKFRFSSTRTDLLLSNLEELGLLIVPRKSDFCMSDESDRIFYDTAKAGQAILVTGNLKHFPKEKSIMSPGDFYDLVL